MTVVIAAATPVWATVEAARAGRPAFGQTYDSYRTGVDGLLVDGGSKAGLDTVALSGEPVIVLATAAPGVLQVELPQQPDGETGYRGPHAPSPAATAAPTALPQPVGAAEIYALGQQFIGVPYLWGGIEGAGIDCSGLIHMSARLGGRVVPRDAHRQWEATRADLTWDDLELGDILYFGDSAALDKIVHVGFWAGDGRMLHAPEEGRHVVVEPLNATQRERCVAFGRFTGSAAR